MNYIKIKIIIIKIVHQSYLRKRKIKLYLKMENNELKIELYPEKEPRYDFPKKSVKEIITKDVLDHSLNPNQSLAYMYSNVPLLNGFYTAHTNHYPIRIKPDDIWLLIVQAFSNHVNANSEELRNLFVNFDGKKTLTVKYPLSDISEVNRKVLEDFSEQINKQMIEYLGEKILDTLTPNFSTTTYDSTIVCKISIMGAFKKYFDYEMMLCGCGVPYIILEGTADDYKKILDKAKDLKKYNFKWYIEKIIPHIQKMIDAKEGKIDVNYFKNMIQKKEITEQRYGPSGMSKYDVKIDIIYGWFLNFFAYYKEVSFGGRVERFEGEEIKVENFKKLANQMLVVPFTIKDEVHKKTYLMKYKVGFVGCDQNQKNEVFPVQGWFVSPSTEEERKSIL